MNFQLELEFDFHDFNMKLFMCNFSFVSFISFTAFSRLGTHGSPRRQNTNNDSVVKHLDLREVKRSTGGMHNTENLAGTLTY